MIGLKEDSEAEEHAAKEDSHARGSAGDERARSGSSRTTRGRGRSGTAEASDGRPCGGFSRTRSRHGARDRRVAQVGRLSTAGVVITTAGGASVVAIAVVYTLGAPFLADVERKSLRVLGNVGGDAVFANASVGQLVL